MTRHRNISASQHVDKDGDLILKARNLQTDDLEIHGSSPRVSAEVLRYLDGSIEPKTRVCGCGGFCRDRCDGEYNGTKEVVGDCAPLHRSHTGFQENTTAFGDGHDTDFHADAGVGAGAHIIVIPNVGGDNVGGRPKRTCPVSVFDFEQGLACDVRLVQPKPTTDIMHETVGTYDQNTTPIKQQANAGCLLPTDPKNPTKIETFDDPAMTVNRIINCDSWAEHELDGPLPCQSRPSSPIKQCLQESWDQVQRTCHQRIKVTSPIKQQRALAQSMISQRPHSDEADKASHPTMPRSPVPPQTNAPRTHRPSLASPIRHGA